MDALEGGRPHGPRSAPAVLITSHDPYRLQELVRRERGRRAIVVIREQRMVAPGVWGVLVYQVRRPRPAWLVPAAWVAGVGAVAGICWWLVATVVTLLAAVGVAGVLGALGTAVLLRGMLRGGCQTTVTIRHRH
jgi:Flp pilus assembly protein TadB